MVREGNESLTYHQGGIDDFEPHALLAPVSGVSQMAIQTHGNLDGPELFTARKEMQQRRPVMIFDWDWHEPHALEGNLQDQLIKQSTNSGEHRTIRAGLPPRLAAARGSSAAHAVSRSLLESRLVFRAFRA